MKKVNILFICLIFLIICLTFCVYQDYNMTIKKVRACEISQQMCTKEIRQNVSGVTGIYDHDGFYCVRTFDRTELEIVSTKNHEVCHYLVDQDFNHFCNH